MYIKKLIKTATFINNNINKTKNLYKFIKNINFIKINNEALNEYQIHWKSEDNKTRPGYFAL